MNKIVWFRYDFRIGDNKAFKDAVISGNVLPIFIYDEEIWKSDFSSSFHLNFIKDSINDLKSVLKKNWNANLNIYSRNTKEIFKALIDKFGVKEIYSHAVFRNKKIADIDDILTVEYNNFIALNTSAIKELIEKIEALEAEIETLKQTNG